MSLRDKIKTFAAPFLPVLRPGGNVLERTYLDVNGRPTIDQSIVKMTEPFGTKIPKKILERASGWSQLPNLSHNFTFEKVQAALRQAEFGDTRMLFGFYRDFFLGNGMVASELSKRKLSTVSEPFSIVPNDKDNPDDVIAAKVIEEALNRCPSFLQSEIHLMNAIVFPVSVLEKTFEAVDETYGINQYNLRYKIKKLYPVDYNLFTYRLPYLPQGPINIGNQPAMAPAPLTQNLTGRPEDTIFDPDSWEPDLRFWSVFNNGLINFSYADMMAPDPDRHIVYRCNLLEGIARENWGGLGRSILWWSIMSQLGADKFLQCLQKYGLPFIVAKVDTSQVDTVEKTMQALTDANIINALAVNKDAIVELIQMNMADASEAHNKFLQFCNDQISLLISGITLASNPKSTGLGSGTAKLQSGVREDIVAYDRLCLNNVLKHQLFKQYLEINMIKGSPPNIVWGGSSTVAEAKDLSITLYNLYQSGITVTDDSMDDLNNRFGLKLEKLPTGQVVDKNGKPVKSDDEEDKSDLNKDTEDDTVDDK